MALSERESITLFLQDLARRWQRRGEQAKSTDGRLFCEAKAAALDDAAQELIDGLDRDPKWSVMR
jgi:hypothetical protein